MKPVRSSLRLVASALLLFSLLLSCTPWRVEYLEKSVDKATQDGVLKRLGPPTSSQEAEGGGSVWTYRYETSPEYSYGRQIERSPCLEILTFDKQKVLRGWTRRDCRDF